MVVFDVASNLTDGHHHHTGAPPCRHGRRKARHGTGDVQSIPLINARGDKDHVRIVAVTGDLVTGEETTINRCVPVAAHGCTMQLTSAHLS